MKIDKNKIIPSDTMILVEPFEKATETSSGLEIAGDATNSYPVLGTILKAGKKSIYKEGVLCLYRKYSIDELRISTGEEEQVVYFLADSDILGTIEDSPSVAKKYSAIEERKVETLLRQEKDKVSEEDKSVKQTPVAPEIKKVAPEAPVKSKGHTK